MYAKAILITFFGIPVCAAILTAFPMLFLMSQSEGPPLTRVDLIQGSVFCIGAIGVIGLSVAAFMRARAAGGSPLGWLAMTVPVLVLAGIAGGAWFGWDIVEGRRKANDDHDQELCTTPAFWGVDQATCLTRSRACRVASWRTTPPAKGDPTYEKLTTALVAIRSRLDQESMAKAKQGGAGYEPPRDYDRLLGTLSSTYEFAVYDRATMLCLFDARK